MLERNRSDRARFHPADDKKRKNVHLLTLSAILGRDMHEERMPRLNQHAVHIVQINANVGNTAHPSTRPEAQSGGLCTGTKTLPVPFLQCHLLTTWQKTMQHAPVPLPL